MSRDPKDLLHQDLTQTPWSLLGRSTSLPHVPVASLSLSCHVVSGSSTPAVPDDPLRNPRLRRHKALQRKTPVVGARSGTLRTALVVSSEDRPKDEVRRDGDEESEVTVHMDWCSEGSYEPLRVVEGTGCLRTG